MKTLVVFSDYQSLPVFYVLEGDKRKWHGVVINCGAEEGYKGSEEDYKNAEEDITMELFPLNLDGRQLEPIKTLSEAIALAMGGELKLDADGSLTSQFFTAVCGFAP